MEIGEIYNLLVEGIELLLSYFTNPEKRIYVLYLLSSAVLAYYIYFKSNNSQSFFKYIFAKKVWLSKSAIVDYWMVFLNGYVKVLFIAPFLIYGLYIAFYTNDYLIQYFGYSSIDLNVTQTLIFYTLALTIVGDFSSYVVHLVMHKTPFLWEFHKVHHSATSLNPITQYRIHPVELIINNARALLVFGLLTGIFDYLSNHQVNKFLFLGVNVFSFIFLFFGANLRHSHVKLKYPNFLEYIFISPFQHQIHHSNNQKHYDTNLGSKFAIWDWIFGTLIVSKSVGKIKFGLGVEDVHFNTFWKNILNPFKNVTLSIKRLLKR